MDPNGAATSDKVQGARHARVEWGPAPVEHLRVTRPLRRSLPDVERELRIRPEQVLQLAYGHDEVVSGTTISLSLHPSLPWLHVPVEVMCFTASQDRHGAVISLEWRAHRFGRMFPTMTADLCLVPDGHNGCELVLDGSYRPPLGLIGLLADRLVGRWVASLTARTFVDRLGERLESN